MIRPPSQPRSGKLGSLAALALLVACSGAPAPHAGDPGVAPGQVASASAANAPGIASAPAATAASRRRAVPGEYLVKFREPRTGIAMKSALRASTFTIRRSSTSVPGLHHVVATGGLDPAVAAAQLAARPDVEYIEPNFLVHASATPDDPMFGKLWGLHNTGQTGGTSTANPDIGALAAWDITTGDPKVVIAVIDTGVDYTHPDLAANIFVNAAECTGNGLDNDGDGYVNDCHGINAINGSGDPMDDYFHGTHVAGTVGAVGDNALGVTGVNWHVTLLPCKFLDASGSGTTADAITCLDYVALMKDRGVNIVASNNSWGGGAYSQALSDAIVAQRNRGILFVAAAGNSSYDNDRLPQYPCSYDLSNILCVASAYDSLSLFSNYGTGTVHLAAPGEGIWSTVPKGGYDAYDGTSMATPHVSGVVALLKAQDSTRDWRVLKNLILAGAVPPTQGQIPTLTGGRLRADRSMNCSNSVVTARMRPALFEPISLAVGATLPLEAININCGQPNGAVVVSVAPGNQTVTLLDDGTGGDEVAGDGVYSGVWTATAPGNYTLTFPGRAGDVVQVVVDAALKAGFPAKMMVVPDINGIVEPAFASVVVGNIDGGPGQDILAPGYEAGPLYAWKGDGTPVPGWPNYAVYSTSWVSLGTFQRGAAAQGVVATYLLDGTRLFNGDGSPIPGWPYPNTVLNLLPTADLDGDGVDEVIGMPARHADGSEVNAVQPVPVGPPANAPLAGATAVADLDADGLPDMVLANSQSIWASNAQGLLPYFPVPTPNATAGGQIYPVIGDVNGDGSPEIIIPAVSWTGIAGYLNVSVLSNRGALLRTLWTTEPVTNATLALADLDGDGIPEIVAATGTQVYVWKGDGSPLPGWPVSVGAGLSVGPVAVGDVDGDGQPDVVLLAAGAYPSSGLLFAFDRHGQPLAGFPKTLPPPLLMATAPAIADLDGSGRNDIIVSRSADGGWRDNIFVYDLMGKGPYGPIEWGQLQGGGGHRGYYETGKNLPNDAFLTTQVHGAGAINSTDGGINCGSTCIHRYPKGTSVQLTALPASGAAFSHWLGPCAGQGNPCTLSVARYTPVAADFASPLTIAVSGPGAVTSSPAGLNCSAGTCTATFAARSQVTLTASPSGAGAFGFWGGACSGTAPTCSLVSDAAQAVSANFVTQRLLQVAFAGQGSARVTSTPAGIDCGNTCAAGFTPGASVSLTVTPAVDTYVAAWGVPGCYAGSPTCIVSLGTDVAATLTLGLKPTLTLDVGGAGSVVVASGGTSVTCTQSCTEAVAPFGSVLELTAVPASGAQFSGWSGQCSGTLNPCTVVITDTSEAVAALFTSEPKLSVALAGSGAGTVTSGDGMLGCPASCDDPVPTGTVVTLTATPSANSSFAGWSGACAGTQTTCTVTVNADASAVATFAASPVASGGSAGSRGGGGGGGVDLWTLLALTTLIVRQAVSGTRRQTRPCAAAYEPRMPPRQSVGVRGPRRVRTSAAPPTRPRIRASACGAAP